MKRVIFGLMALTIAVVLVAISMAVTTSKVQEAQAQIFSISPTTEGSASTTLLTVHTHQVIQPEFLGVNATYHGFAFMPEQINKGMTPQDQAREFDRVARMGLNIARTWYRPDYACVQSWADCQWNAITGTRLYSMYLWLDKMKALNVDVALQAGWWLSDVQAGDWGEHKSFNAISFTQGITGYAKWVSRSISETVFKRGYTNIKYVIMLTEPTNNWDDNISCDDSQWEFYAKAVTAVHQQLVSDSLRSLVKLVGPNNSDRACHLDKAVSELSNVLDIFSGHEYGIGGYMSGYPDWYSLCNSMVITVSSTGKPVWLDEFGKMDKLNTGLRDSPEYGNYVAQAVAGCMNARIQSPLLWILFDQQYVTARADTTDPTDQFFDGVHRWGTCYWPHDNTLPAPADPASCRPSWYAFSLMSKYLGGRGGTQVYNTISAADLYLSAVKRPDGNWSFLVVNGSDEGRTFAVNLTPAVAAVSLYRYLYDPANIVPTPAAQLIGYDKIFPAVSTSFSDWIPARAVVIYSSLQGVSLPSHITVTNTADSGSGSLRWAIANLQPGGTIGFAFTQATTITLTSNSVPTTALVINKSVTINGPGADKLTISGGHARRVFDIGAENSLEIQNLTIADGSARGSPFEGGGCLRNTGVLTLTNSILTRCEADYGGGIHNDGDGRVIVRSSTFFSNTATRDGGGIYNFGNGLITIQAGSVLSANHANMSGGGVLNWAAGAMAFDQATVINNTAQYGGGGVANGDHGTVTIAHNTLAGNSAMLQGGAIVNWDNGTLTMEDTTLSGNRTLNDAPPGGGGGALYNANAASLNKVTFNGNSAYGRGGAMYNIGNSGMTAVIFKDNFAYIGGGMYNTGTLTLAGAVFAGNSAQPPSSRTPTVGGGMYTDEGEVVLTNVTFSGNDVFGFGAGLYVGGGYVTLINNTLAGNTARVTPFQGSNGGGLYRSNGTFEIDNSIVANNTPNDCWGTITSGGYNLDSDGSCQLSGTADLTHTNPLLGPLKDNGGSTLTHALLPGSPAIDRIPFSVNGCGTAITVDQRGVTRPLDGNADGVAACDIGAYERSGTIYFPLVMRNH